jgi:hypothetical protein
MPVEPLSSTMEPIASLMINHLINLIQCELFPFVKPGFLQLSQTPQNWIFFSNSSRDESPDMLNGVQVR